MEDAEKERLRAEQVLQAACKLLIKVLLDFACNYPLASVLG